MALAAPGRPGDPRPRAAASARSDVDSPRGVRFTDIVDLDSKAGSPEWGRPGFVFSARVRGRRPDGLLLLETPFGRLGVRGAEAEGLIRLRVERFGEGFALRLLGRGTEPAPPEGAAAGRAALSEAAFLRGFGLPADRLSASLVSFARAFGLALAPSALKALRRAALRLGGDREAAALAAVAAEAKGARLSDEALGEYVAAIDARAEGDGKEGGRRQGSDPRQRQGAEETERKRSGSPSAEELRGRFGELAAAGDALSYLNRLPASDGTRWVVFPVRLEREGVEFRAVVRILLLANHGSGLGRVGRWAVDVAAGGRTWSFDADRLGAPSPSLRVSADPPFGMDSARVRAALAAVFEPLGHDVQVSASRDEARFPEARSDFPTVLDAEA